MAVKAPAGAGDTLSVHCERGGVTAFHGDGEKVTDAAVFRYGSVTDAVEDGFSVRGKLGIGEAAKGEEHLRSHMPVRDFNAGGADVTLLWFHLGLFAGEGGAHGCSHRNGELKNLHIVSKRFSILP